MGLIELVIMRTTYSLKFLGRRYLPPCKNHCESRSLDADTFRAIWNNQTDASQPWYWARRYIPAYLTIITNLSFDENMLEHN